MPPLIASPTCKPVLVALPSWVPTGPWAHIHQMLPHIACKDVHTCMYPLLDDKIIQGQDQLFFYISTPIGLYTTLGTAPMLKKLLVNSTNLFQGSEARCVLNLKLVPPTLLLSLIS